MRRPKTGPTKLECTCSACSNSHKCSMGLGIVLSFCGVERVVVTINPPSEVYERGSGDQSRSPPLILREDCCFARSVPVPLQSAQLDREADAQSVSLCCGLRDSSRGLFFTRHCISRSCPNRVWARCPTRVRLFVGAIAHSYELDCVVLLGGTLSSVFEYVRDGSRSSER